MIDVVVGILAVLFVLFFYFVPSFIAWRRDHHQAPAIIFINVFLGWTGIGWIVASAMALSAVRTDVVAR